MKNEKYIRRLHNGKMQEIDLSIPIPPNLKLSDIQKRYYAAYYAAEELDLSKEFYPVPKVYKAKKEPKPMNQIGKKGAEDIIARSENKEEMEKLGITSCELKYPGCWHNNALTFAHAEKRRKLIRQDLNTVIVACSPCHAIIEILPPEEMKEIVLTTISKRT